MKSALDLVAEAKARIHEVGLGEAEAAIREADVLIDVREPDEYRSGHIPGSVNVPRGLLEFKLSSDPALADRGLRCVIYCKSSGRAALAAAAMLDMGYMHVKSLAGGFDAWSEAGLPRVKPDTPEFT